MKKWTKQCLAMLFVIALAMGSSGMEVCATEVRAGSMMPRSLKGISGKIALTTEIFKDENVLKTVMKYDEDEDGYLEQSEIDKITQIRIRDCVVDASGLELLTSVTEMNLSYYSGTSIKVGKSVREINIKAISSSISIDAPAVIYVTVFTDGNMCEKIDVSKCGKMESFRGGGKSLATLKFPKNGGKLKKVRLSNLPQKFTVPVVKKLQYLSIYENDELTNLNLKNIPNIGTLVILSNPKLTTLNISKNTGLKKLVCEYNGIKKLDLDKNVNLTSISCVGNSLTKLDCSKNKKLTALACYNNKLTSLKIAKATNLQSVDCSDNELLSLNVSKNVKLEQLNCSKNKLSSLDISKNSNLKELNCSNNGITSLKCSKNSNLTTLYCYANPLKELFIKDAKNVLDKVLVTPIIASVGIEEYSMTVTLKSQNKGYRYLVRVFRMGKDYNEGTAALSDEETTVRFSIYAPKERYTIGVLGATVYNGVLVYASPELSYEYQKE